MSLLGLILAKSTAKTVVTHWARRLGGAGLLLAAIGDSSIIPSFGSLDALLVIFSARTPQDWPYYALMALIGSTIGGYVTYRMGEKGGKETLERRFSKNQLEKVYRWTEKHSFLAVSIPTFLPPPTPLSPFLLAAGAMKVTRKKFLLAYCTTRAARYALVGWLGSKYGRATFEWLRPYQKPILIAFICLAVAGTPVGIWFWHKAKKRKPAPPARHPKAA